MFLCRLLSQGFLSLLLHHYGAAQHIFSPYPVGWRGLVEGLYLFTLYALPLTVILTAFGSDRPCKGFSSLIPRSSSLAYLTGSPGTAHRQLRIDYAACKYLQT